MMKKQRYISLIRASMSCLVVLSVLSSGQLMAGPFAPDFGRLDNQTAAVQSRMMSAQLASQPAASTQVKMALPALQGKLMVTNLNRTNSGSPLFFSQNVAPNSADADRYQQAVTENHATETANLDRYEARLHALYQSTQYTSQEVLNVLASMGPGGGGLGSTFPINEGTTTHANGLACRAGGCQTLGGSSTGYSPGVTGTIPKSLYAEDHVVPPTP
jgi:hypothetical protein